MIAAFAAVFAVSLLIVSIFIPIFSSAVQRSALSGVDQALGFLFGVARGVLLIGVAFLVYNRLVANSAVPMIDNSRSAKVFASFEDKLNQQVPSDAPGWIAARYNDLTGKCGTPGAQATGTTESRRQAPLLIRPPDRLSTHRRKDRHSLTRAQTLRLRSCRKSARWA